MGLQLTREFLDVYKELEINYQMKCHGLDPQDPDARKMVEKALGNHISDESTRNTVAASIICIGTRYAAMSADLDVSISNEDGSYFSDEFSRHASHFFKDREGCLPLLYRDALNSSNPVMSGEWGELLLDGQRLRYKLNEIRQIKTDRIKAKVTRR